MGDGKVDGNPGCVQLNRPVCASRLGSCAAREARDVVAQCGVGGIVCRELAFGADVEAEVADLPGNDVAQVRVTHRCWTLGRRPPTACCSEASAVIMLLLLRLRLLLGEPRA